MNSEKNIITEWYDGKYLVYRKNWNSGSGSNRTLEVLPVLSDITFNRETCSVDYLRELKWIFTSLCTDYEIAYWRCGGAPRLILQELLDCIETGENTHTEVDILITDKLASEHWINSNIHEADPKPNNCSDENCAYAKLFKEPFLGDTTNYFQLVRDEIFETFFTRLNNGLGSSSTSRNN